jgi:hypothetical protein
MKRTALLYACALIGGAAIAQEKVPLPPLPAPQSVPGPAPDTGRPYAPQAILPGGIVVPARVVGIVSGPRFIRT